MDIVGPDEEHSAYVVDNGGSQLRFADGVFRENWQRLRTVVGYDKYPADIGQRGNVEAEEVRSPSPRWLTHSSLFTRITTVEQTL